MVVIGRHLEIKSLAGLDRHSPAAQAWTSLVQANCHSGFMQSLQWAHFKAQQGIAALHLGVFDGEELVAGSIFYYATGENGAAFLVAPHGPVLPWRQEDLALACLTAIVNYCENLSRQRDSGLIGLRIEPRLPFPVPDILLEFGRAPMDLLPQETLSLDLTGSLEDILTSMKPKGRYNTKLSQRKGVNVRCGTTGEVIDVFYPVLCEAGRRDDFAVEPLSFFVELASTLMPAGMATLLIAEHDGEALGGLIMIIYGQTATYLYGGISNTKRNLMAGYALQWEALKLAKLAGCAQYDLYGFDRFCNPRNRYGRFSRFKSQFGGEVQRFIGAHDYFFVDQLTDTLVRVFRDVENNLL